MKIILMGTPEFGLTTFKTVAADHDIVAVYTQAPKPAGRGHSIKKSAVHIWADEMGFPVYFPDNFKDYADIERFKSFGADVAIVAAYGILLPHEVLHATRLGCINIHASLLPKYRGAAPIHRAVMNGDTETGVCLMQMDEGLDTGDVLMCEKIVINRADTTGDVHDKLSVLGANLVHLYLKNSTIAKPKKQSMMEGEPSYAKKLTAEDEIIDWTKSAAEIANKVRGLFPYPRARAKFQGRDCKILQADLYEELKVNQEKKPGQIIKVSDRGAIVQCGIGQVRIVWIQPAGKSGMAMEDFLRGVRTENPGFDL